eukprot:4661700-Alexandrium_andersonii.AAC.1
MPNRAGWRKARGGGPAPVAHCAPGGDRAAGATAKGLTPRPPQAPGRARQRWGHCRLRTGPPPSR